MSRNKNRAIIQEVIENRYLAGELQEQGKSTEEEPPKSDQLSLCAFLKKKGYWKPLVNTVKFATHFLSVMLVLFLGALVFAELEDPENLFTDAANKSDFTLQNQSTATTTNHANASMLFWKAVEENYNISVDKSFRHLLLNDFKTFLVEEFERNLTAIYAKEVRNRKFIFLKWFYFNIIATTTIGYGDISPKTEEGKLFYIFFSIIGIFLMMTLLRSCGNILTIVNTYVYKRINNQINRTFHRQKPCVSDELLSVITLIIIFTGYLFAGSFFFRYHGHVMTDWSVIECIYFWIVTFTTVGFGDFTNPVEVEIDHFHEFVFYRIFGLTFLAGIIDSIYAYLKMRRKLFKRLHEEISKRTVMIPNLIKNKAPEKGSTRDQTL